MLFHIHTVHPWVFIIQSLWLLFTHHWQLQLFLLHTVHGIRLSQFFIATQRATSPGSSLLVGVLNFRFMEDSLIYNVPVLVEGWRTSVAEVTVWSADVDAVGSVGRDAGHCTSVIDTHQMNSIKYERNCLKWGKEQTLWNIPLVSASNSSGGPFSTIFPSWSTIIRSEFLIVERRWAIVIVVRPSEAKSMAAFTSSSWILSNAEVASSKIRTMGLRITALAIATLCFCPPESWCPLSPTRVLIPSGRLLMNFQAPTFLAASLISCWKASKLINFGFQCTVPV